jgi:large subunit ribosomal protein L17
MRHRHEGRKLGKTAEHRKAMLSNMVTSLFERERIQTTIPKAKEVRKLAERIITQARRGNAAAAGGRAERQLAARRHVARTVRDPEILKKLFDEIAPRYVERPGGYTRILRLGTTRVGDAAQNALLELLKKDEEGRKKKKKPRKTYHKVEIPIAPAAKKAAPPVEAPPAEAAAEGATAAEGAPGAEIAPAASAAAPAEKHKKEAPKKEKAHKAEASKSAGQQKAKAKAKHSKPKKKK